MAVDSVKRRLAAILAADMVGYSRLMQIDEAGTVARQSACLKELVKFRTAGNGVTRKGHVYRFLRQCLALAFQLRLNLTP